MSRIPGIDPDSAEGPIRATLVAQAKKWGGPLLNYLGPQLLLNPSRVRGLTQ